jgi:hypothetical protein
VNDVEASGWICLLFGAAGLVQGVRFRSGISRRMMAENYRNANLPKTRRNGPFALIPLSLAFVLVGVAAIKGMDVSPVLVFGIVAAALASGLMALFVFISPPAWSKPRWLREAETGGWQTYRPESRRGDVIFTAILAISAFGAMAMIVVTSFQLVELIGPLLLGVGTALAFWGGRRRAGRS